MKVEVKDIKRGDMYNDPQGIGGWRALEDATIRENSEVHLKVEHEPDGGLGFRVWTDPHYELEIEQP